MPGPISDTYEGPSDDKPEIPAWALPKQHSVPQQEDFLDAIHSSTLSSEKKAEWERICLWEAVNEYVAACEGDTSDATISDRRMNAVVAVERAVDGIRRGAAKQPKSVSLQEPSNKEYLTVHPAISHVLKFFAHSHLPEHLQAISKPFCELAEQVANRAPDNQETTVALRLLLMAKDAAVRAVL